MLLFKVNNLRCFSLKARMRSMSHFILMMESTFFGVVVKPGFVFKSLFKDELFLTKAVIDPEATAEQTSRLFINIDHKNMPICQLDGQNILQAEFFVQIYPGMEVILTAVGDCPIHLSGFFPPSRDITSNCGILPNLI